MARSDDLSPLLAAKPPLALGMRQGLVLGWDTVTLANSVQVGDSIVDNLPVLTSTDAALVAIGDSVIILTFGPSWLILGRVTTP